MEREYAKPDFHHPQVEHKFEIESVLSESRTTSWIPNLVSDTSENALSHLYSLKATIYHSERSSLDLRNPRKVTLLVHFTPTTLEYIHLFVLKMAPSINITVEFT